MRSPLFGAAAALLMLKPALAAKSPVPVSFGYNKALNFTLDENNDMVFGAATDMENLPHHPHVNLLGGVGLRTPPVFNHQGSCCRPTAQCHAYFKWVIDMINPTPQWDSDGQRSEAMAHLDCCMRQYRASCADPPKGHMVVWRDPARLCSNGPDADDDDDEVDDLGKQDLFDAVDALPGPLDLGGTEGLELPEKQEDVKVEEEQAEGDGQVKANDEAEVDGPSVDESSVDDANVNEPDVNEPDVNEPNVNEPDVNEPNVNEPDVNEPNVNEPNVNEPNVNEPNVDEAGEQN